MTNEILIAIKLSRNPQGRLCVSMRAIGHADQEVRKTSRDLQIEISNALDRILPGQATTPLTIVERIIPKQS